MKKIGYLWLLCIALASSNSWASANTFIRETERLIALSDKTFTVIVDQYEQSFSYWSGTTRLMVRVIDRATNEIISEVILSAAKSVRSDKKPYETTYSAVDGDYQALKGVLIEPQMLYENLEQPKFRFQLDARGIYLEKNGQQAVLDFSVVESRFSKAGANLNKPMDSNPGNRLRYAIESNDIEFTGWYKTTINKQQTFFLVLKIGRFDDDTGGMEYVFSIPDRK